MVRISDKEYGDDECREKTNFCYCCNVQFADDDSNRSKSCQQTCVKCMEDLRNFHENVNDDLSNTEKAQF